MEEFSKLLSEFIEKKYESNLCYFITNFYSVYEKIPEYIFSNLVFQQFENEIQFIDQEMAGGNNNIDITKLIKISNKLLLSIK